MENQEKQAIQPSAALRTAEELFTASYGHPLQVSGELPMAKRKFRWQISIKAVVVISGLLIAVAAVVFIWNNTSSDLGSAKVKKVSAVSGSVQKTPLESSDELSATSLGQLTLSAEHEVEPIARSAIGSAGSSSGVGSSWQYLQVLGAVNEPGVVRVPEGARVFDAVFAAGGAKPEAELASVNQARFAIDGEVIYLLAKGETPPKWIDEDNDAVTARKGSLSDGSGDLLTSKGSGEKLNINTASASELESLPGIGAGLASKIISYRTENGNFASVEELKLVSGIGERKFAGLVELVTAD